MTNPAQMPTFRASTTEEIEREIEVLNIYKESPINSAPFVVSVCNHNDPHMAGPSSGFARLVKDDDGRIVGVKIVSSPLNAHRFSRQTAAEIATWESSFVVASFHKSCEQRQADLTA